MLLSYSPGVKNHSFEVFIYMSCQIIVSTHVNIHQFYGWIKPKFLIFKVAGKYKVLTLQGTTKLKQQLLLLFLALLKFLLTIESDASLIESTMGLFQIDC